MLYDSINPLHREWANIQFSKPPVEDEIWINISQMSCKPVVQELVELNDLDIEKLGDKNRPTLFYKEQNKLVQISLPDS